MIWTKLKLAAAINILTIAFILSTGPLAGGAWCSYEEEDERECDDQCIASDAGDGWWLDVDKFVCQANWWWHDGSFSDFVSEEWEIDEACSTLAADCDWWAGGGNGGR